MARDRVVVERLSDVGHDRYAEGCVLVWFLADAGDFGGTLDGTTTESELATALGDAWNDLVVDVEAGVVANETGGIWDKRARTLVWPSHKAAAGALKLIKARVAARKAGRPMPEWAQKALTAGWKPPKGWTP